MAKRKTELMDLVKGPIFKDGKKFREARNAAVDAIRSSDLESPLKELIARLAESWNTSAGCGCGCGLARLATEALGLPKSEAENPWTKLRIAAQLNDAVNEGYLREIPQERGHYRVFEVLLSQIPGITGVTSTPASVLPPIEAKKKAPMQDTLTALGIPVTDEKETPPWHDDDMPEEFETGTEVTSAAEDSLERLLRDLHEIHPDWALWKRERL